MPDLTCPSDQNHSINLDAAAALTRRYRESNSGTKGGFFGKEAIMRILEQSDCTGIKYYYGMDEDSNKVLIIVGATLDCNDLTDGEIIEMSLPCPDYCGSANDLNS